VIHTRQQLIDWLYENVDDCLILLAMNSGDLEVLGGFDPLPASSNPGWLIQVTSGTGRVHYIAIAQRRDQLGRFYWFRAPRVEWSRWMGDVGDRLAQGDRPELYAELKGAPDVEPK